MFFNIFLFCLKGYSETLKTGITLACFKISGKAPNEKDQLMRLNIGLDKHFLKSLRILVGKLPGPVVLFVLMYLGCLQHPPLLWVIRKSFRSNFLYMSGKIWVFWDFINKNFCN